MLEVGDYFGRWRKVEQDERLFWGYYISVGV